MKKGLISLSVDITNFTSICQTVPFWTFEIFSVRVGAALGSWGVAGGRKSV